MRWWRRLCLRATFAASNVLFFGGSIWLLAAGARVRRDGWLDVFEDDYPWFHTAYVLLIVLLSLLVASLAISGLYSVVFKRKEWVLRVYAASALLTFVFCLFLTLEGGFSLATAHSWRARRFVDPAIEGHVEANFNDAYCLAQAAYVCTASANAQWLVHFGSDDLRDLYLDAGIADRIKQAMAAERLTGGRNLLQLCEDEGSVLHAPTLDRNIANLCSWCGDVVDLKSYVHLVAWANAKCPPGRPTAAFCVRSVWLNYTNPQSEAPPLDSPVGVFALPLPPPPTAADDDDAPSGATDTPPYVTCRKTFLSYWSYLSQWFLVLSLLLLAFMAVVIRVAWVVLRPKPDRYSARHGRKPERKPLVQLASKAAAASTPATTTRATPPPMASKPSAAATAKALFTKDKSGK